MSRIVIYIFLLNFVYSQYVNQETGWSYHQSSNQSFYIFEQIQIDGDFALGDGWAYDVTQPSECLENFNTCDVVGAFIDDVCVGWVYADFQGETTLPVMGYDDTNSQTEENTNSYCSSGDIPEIKIYDASNGTVLAMIPGEDLPPWQNNFAHVIFNISFANNGVYDSSTGWNYYQSSEQAFYLFESIQIEDIDAESSDIIGAFKDDICVGWINVNENGYTSVPVMGAEIDNFSNYMNVGEIPIFKIYDNSEDEILDFLAADIIPSWSNNNYYIIEGVSQSVVYGCLDPNASNYNPEADLQCESCCLYVQEIEFSSGWNMFSLNVNPIYSNLYDILEPVHSQLALVLDETGSAIFPDESGVLWTDNIGDWSATEGYLLKVNNNVVLSIENEGIISLPLNIPLTAGWNIMSYPSQGQNDVEFVLNSLVESQNLYSVFDEAGNVFIPDVVNTINSLHPGEAYYIKVNEDDTLIINNDLENFDDMNLEHHLSRTEHFNPIWSGNPFSPMTIFIDIALWDIYNLSEGDEIGVFDGLNCVGVGIIPEGDFVDYSNFQIVTSKDDGSGNGYVEGNNISFRIWKADEEVDIDASIINFVDELGSEMEPLFESLRAPFAEIKVFGPSSVPSFNVSAQNYNEIALSWDRPLVGDYQIYNYPDPGSYNAVTFTIVGDSGFNIQQLDADNVLDVNLDNNTSYTYDIQSVSIVSESDVVTSQALTKPGTPVLSLEGGVNQIILTWENPEVTGVDGVIDYQVQRKWDVGDVSNVNIDITGFDNDNTDYIFVDNNLLNSTAYSYRVRAHNETGYSNWSSPYLEQFTNNSQGNVASVINIQDTTYQLISPPNNIVDINWDEIDGVVSYNIYENNLLLDISLAEFYIDPSIEGRQLETSTLYQYIVTAVDVNGEESSPSELIQVVTLPEYIPESPDSLIVDSGQNKMTLSWEPVLGYGDPIGGAAQLYNIYRFDIDNYSVDSIDALDVVGTSDNSSYIDYSLDDNLFYCYGVSGVNSENVEGPISQIACNETYSQLEASIPIGLTAIGGDQQASLSWQASTGSPPISYQVYRSGDGFSNQFVANTLNTSYIDNNLSSNSEYTYYVVAWNELGASLPSLFVSAATNFQSNVLAADIPEDLSVFLDQNARASNYIDGYAQLSWDAKFHSNHPFVLAYEGNPYSPHTIVIESVEFEDETLVIEDGDVIAIYDNQLCVGLATWPLSGGQMSASKDDGTGNGFSEGNQGYFKIWDASTGHVSTAIESPNIIFSGLGLSYISLDIMKDEYNIYRNGQEIVNNHDGESYQDSALESGMEYMYAVSAVNDLGLIYESNISSYETVSTLDYDHNAPDFSVIDNQVIDEDSLLILDLIASDLDNDQIIYFAQPVELDAPLTCEIFENQLIVSPSANYFGNWAIEVFAFDDSTFYESNTLFDIQDFELTVNSVNDGPKILNSLSDIEILEGDYQDYLYIALDDVFIDVDIEIMDSDALSYNVSNSNTDVILTQAIDSQIEIQFLTSGESDVYIEAVDQYGESASDTINVIVQEVLSADDSVFPEIYNISNVYPNPFNPIASIDIEIPTSSRVDIVIYNIEGKLIDKLFSGYLPKGYYSMKWNASEFSSGVYFVSMISDAGRITRKAILLK